MDGMVNTLEHSSNQMGQKKYFLYVLSTPLTVKLF